MSHLGERVTTLVDGQLDIEASDRALIHIAGCERCRHEVEVERLMKQQLATLGAPQLGGDLVHRLLEMSGPSGPLPPRPGHVPGSPRPQLTTTAGPGRVVLLPEPLRPTATVVAGRPPGRRGSTRPALVRPATVRRMVRVSRSSRTRVAAAMVGAVCLVSAGVAGGIANGGVVDQRVVPPVDSFVLAHSVTTSSLPFSDQTVLWGAVGANR